MMFGNMGTVIAYVHISLNKDVMVGVVYLAEYRITRQRERERARKPTNL